jgi:hypothetical protein
MWSTFRDSPRLIDTIFKWWITVSRSSMGSILDSIMLPCGEARQIVMDAYHIYSPTRFVALRLG